MRTDSAGEVKHFRFVASARVVARTHLVTRARATEITRNARCVHRFVAKPVDSSRAVAKTCARARANGHVTREQYADATEKEIFSEGRAGMRFTAVHARSARVRARARDAHCRRRSSRHRVARVGRGLATRIAVMRAHTAHRPDENGGRTRAGNARGARTRRSPGPSPGLHGVAPSRFELPLPP